MGTWETLESKDFGLSAKTIIRVARVRNNRGEVLDIRQHFKADDGSWQPTKKGVAIPIADSESSAKVVLLEGLKLAGVGEKEITDHFEFERVMGSDDGTWVDPAGGIHDDNEEDPAAMYE